MKGRRVELAYFALRIMVYEQILSLLQYVQEADYIIVTYEGSSCANLQFCRSGLLLLISFHVGHACLFAHKSIEKQYNEAPHRS